MKNAHRKSDAGAAPKSDLHTPVATSPSLPCNSRPFVFIRGLFCVVPVESSVFSVCSVDHWMPLVSFRLNLWEPSILGSFLIPVPSRQWQVSAPVRIRFHQQRLVDGEFRPIEAVR
jgi:hypothetical protein